MCMPPPQRIREMERRLEEETEEDAHAVHGSCFAVRSALTDDGRPPLDASGLTRSTRLQQIDHSMDRVAEKRGFPNPSYVCRVY